jgi:hypothetical protein
MDTIINWIVELGRWLLQTKARPVASFTERVQWIRKVPCIRIKNSSGEYDIEVKGVYVKPKVYFLTEDMEVRTLIEGAERSLIEGVEGAQPTFVLRPQQERELYIAPRYKDGIAMDSENQNVTFRISWRKCNVMWLPQIPVYVRATTSTIRRYRPPQSTD